MSSPDVIRWFDDNWKPTRDRARSGWNSLARRDQVLAAVGFLVDSCMGDGVAAIVDGIASGSDGGLTARLPDALDELGFGAAAEYVRAIVRLRTPSGSSATDESNRIAAIDQWREVRRIFEQRTPDGERLMVARLHEWYQTPAGPSAYGSTEPPADLPPKSAAPARAAAPKAAAPKAAAPKAAPKKAKPAKPTAKKAPKKAPKKVEKKAAPKKAAKKAPAKKSKPAPAKKAVKKKRK